MGRVPVPRAARRSRRWPVHGGGGRGPTDPVVVLDLPGQHQPVRPQPGYRLVQPGVGLHHGVRRRAGRQDLASAARHAGRELRRDLQHPHQAERAPDGSGRQRQRERARQHRRTVLQSRPGDRRPGQDGGPDAGRRDRRHCRGGPPVGPPRGPERCVGLLFRCADQRVVGTAVARAAQPSHARRYRRAQQRRGPGRHRRRQRADGDPHASAHPSVGGVLFQLRIHLSPARPREQRRDRGRGRDRGRRAGRPSL